MADQPRTALQLSGLFLVIALVTPRANGGESRPVQFGAGGSEGYISQSFLPGASRLLFPQQAPGGSWKRIAVVCDGVTEEQTRILAKLAEQGVGIRILVQKPMSRTALSTFDDANLTRLVSAGVSIRAETDDQHTASFGVFDTERVAIPAGISKRSGRVGPAAVISDKTVAAAFLKNFDDAYGRAQEYAPREASGEGTEKEQPEKAEAQPKNLDRGGTSVKVGTSSPPTLLYPVFTLKEAVDTVTDARIPNSDLLKGPLDLMVWAPPGSFDVGKETEDLPALLAATLNRFRTSVSNASLILDPSIKADAIKKWFQEEYDIPVKVIRPSEPIASIGVVVTVSEHNPEPYGVEFFGAASGGVVISGHTHSQYGIFSAVGDPGKGGKGNEPLSYLPKCSTQSDLKRVE